MHSSKILMYAHPEMPRSPEEFKELKIMTLGYFILGDSITEKQDKYSMADLKKSAIMKYRPINSKTIEALVKEGMLKSEEKRIELKDTEYKQATEVRKLYSITNEGKKYWWDNFTQNKIE
jgi:hypothetical protein